MGPLHRSAQAEKTGREHRRNFHLAAAAVTIQNRGGEIQRHGGRNPKLPVGDDTLTARAAGDTHLRGEPPKSQNISHERHGYQQSATSQRQMTIFATPALHGPAGMQPDANNHKSAYF